MDVPYQYMWFQKVLLLTTANGSFGFYQGDYLISIKTFSSFLLPPASLRLPSVSIQSSLLLNPDIHINYLLSTHRNGKSVRRRSESSPRCFSSSSAASSLWPCLLLSSSTSKAGAPWSPSTLLSSLSLPSASATLLLGKKVKEMNLLCVYVSSVHFIEFFSWWVRKMLTVKEDVDSLLINEYCLWLV